MNASFVPKQATVTCPECGSKHEIDVWEIVNTRADPLIASKLRSVDLYQWVCPECGYRDLVTYRTLYHDVGHKVLVLSEPPRKQRTEEATRILDAMLAGGTYRDFGIEGWQARALATVSLSGHTGRLTTHPDIQAEKARIFWDGYDDRVIELLKVIFVGQLIGQHELYGTTLALYQHYRTDRGFMLKVVGVEEGAVVSMRTYRRARDLFKDQIEAAAHAYVIDRDWALRALGMPVEEARELVAGDGD